MRYNTRTIVGTLKNYRNSLLKRAKGISLEFSSHFSYEASHEAFPLVATSIRFSIYQRTGQPSPSLNIFLDRILQEKFEYAEEFTEATKMRYFS